MSQNSSDQYFCDLLHETHNLTHAKISNIISTAFHSDSIFIIHTSVKSNGFFSMDKNKNYISINDLSESKTHNFNYCNDELFLLSLNNNKPIIIEEYLLNNDSEELSKKYRSLGFTNSIAYHYKSPCSKGIYIILGFKNISPATLSNNIFLLHLLSPHIYRYMNVSMYGDVSNYNTPLSVREEQTLKLYKIGLRPREICKQLHISERTVRFHMDNIVTKLNAKNKIHALSIALTNKYI